MRWPWQKKPQPEPHWDPWVRLPCFHCQAPRRMGVESKTLKSIYVTYVENCANCGDLQQAWRDWREVE